MEETVQSIIAESPLLAPSGAAPNLDRCTRCLQLLPYKAQRCPDCGQPAKSRRALPLLIGVAGVLALLFVLGLMWRMVANEEFAKAPVLVDDASTRQEEILPEIPPDDGKAKKPEEPAKRPPLDDR
jgi:hypothetical protein